MRNYFAFRCPPTVRPAGHRNHSFRALTLIGIVHCVAIPIEVAPIQSPLLSVSLRLVFRRVIQGYRRCSRLRLIVWS